MLADLHAGGYAYLLFVQYPRYPKIAATGTKIKCQTFLHNLTLDSFILLPASPSCCQLSTWLRAMQQVLHTLVPLHHDHQQHYPDLLG